MAQSSIPGGGELRSPPPVILSRTAHRTRTHTRRRDPHVTRDKHAEPHETSLKTHTQTRFSSLHIKLSYVCGTVSYLISLLGCRVCMLATSPRVAWSLVALSAHGVEHVVIQAKCRGHGRSPPRLSCGLLAQECSEDQECYGSIKNQCRTIQLSLECTQTK